MRRFWLICAGYIRLQFTLLGCGQSTSSRRRAAALSAVLGVIRAAQSYAPSAMRRADNVSANRRGLALEG